MVLFESHRRFEAFQKKLADYRIEYDILRFDSEEWMNYDYSKVDAVIYFPQFEHSSYEMHVFSKFISGGPRTKPPAPIEIAEWFEVQQHEPERAHWT